MKILHVIANLDPCSGGPTTVVRSLSEFQALFNFDVTVCTTNWTYSKKEKKPRNSNFFKNGVNYIYFSYFSPLLLSIEMSKWLKKNIRLFNIVHIHGLYRFPVTFAACCARKARVPYIIVPHGSLDPFLYTQSEYNVALKRIYERLFDIPNLNHAAGVLYTTEEEAKRANFLGLKSKPFIVPNGIDWNSFEKLPHPGCFRRRLSLDAKTPLVLFLGRINYIKGLDFLISSFSIVLEKHPTANLVLVGPDNNDYSYDVKQWCKDQGIQKNVLFVDHLDFEEVKEAYVDADVFVLPSYTENFGLAAVEAMACGTPVIISDHVNISHQIQDSGAGVVVRLDQNEIAKAITNLLENDKAAKVIGMRGRLTVKKLYSWPRIIKQLTLIYEKLINPTDCREGVYH